MFDYVKSVVKDAMDQPDTSTRLVYLIQGAAVGAGVLILTVAFIFTKHPEGYTEMILAVGGGAAGGGLAHAAIKYANMGRSEFNGKDKEPQ